MLPTCTFLTQIGNYLTFEFVDLNKAELINFGTSAQTLTFTATPNASKLSAVNFNRTSARYQLRILFNAQEYYRQNVGTSYFEGVRQIELYSTYITFNVIQSASSVEVGSSNSTISIGTTAKIQASKAQMWTIF